ncbi:Protein of unknown function DUF1376 [uncultured Caudovirales phage]|uniref:Uncharacterized protein n=1 Tax=uncultured Caudovirales phage TaxID=2100421 RepID=A0A6J7WFE1_9CAUD|nr:Protein of unknown function DUF1376 [uncultured Caudovirales phage]
MNFYPFHIGDYLSHTSHLTDEEDLAYRRMIDLYYQTEAPFNDTAKLARKVRASFEVVGSLLHEFFVYEDGAWHNKRADVEIAKYQAMKDGGRKGAAIRWLKGSDTPPITPPKQPLMPTKNHEPRTKNQIKNTIAKPDGLTDLLWNDFLILRKSKKLPVTQTAFNGIAKEAHKANKTLSEAIQICCERGWGGFKAEWLQSDSVRTVDKPAQRWDATLEGVIAKGKELGILPKPGETEGQYRERVKQG